MERGKTADRIQEKLSAAQMQKSPACRGFFWSVSLTIEPCFTRQQTPKHGKHRLNDLPNLLRRLLEPAAESARY